MVIEFVPLSPKKSESNDEDCFYRDKPIASESSDEDTASSSLLPIPRTLDDMRNELKSTINNFCGATDFESPKPDDFSVSGLHLEHPTEREVSIAQKITSANLILDDLLKNTNLLPSKSSPCICTTVRQRGKATESEGSGNVRKFFLLPRQGPMFATVTEPGTESIYSSECCSNIPVAPFVFPPPVDSRWQCERKEAANPQPEPVIQKPGAKKPHRRNFLSERIRSMRLKCKKRKKQLLVQQTQTESVSGPECPRTLPMNFPALDERCSCSNGPSSPEPECNCSSITNPTKDCHCETARKHAEVANDAPEPPVVNLKFCQEQGPKKEEVPPTRPEKALLKPMPARTAKSKERIDVYYFDHGNSAYYRTTDSHPAKFTEYIIEKTDRYATKFWAEIFGTVTIGIAFVISFVLQLYRCLFTAVIRALTVGLIQIFSDYFFKPLLTVIFNGLIQPCLILGYNIATSTKDFCVPVCEICEFCAKDLSIIFRSCRIIEINQRTCSSPSCPCKQNV